MEKHDIFPAMPRIPGLQRIRVNTPTNRPQTKRIYSHDRSNVGKLNCSLWPSYTELLSTRQSAPKEYSRKEERCIYWNYQRCIKIKNVEYSSTNVPQMIVKALDACNIEIFPIVHRLLRILGTLPVSVASAERTFSCLKRLKREWEREWLRIG